MPEKGEAIEFFNSIRGQYIISQALYLAIESIKARTILKQEPSNMADMQFLLDNLFPIFKSVAEAEKKLKIWNDLEDIRR